MDCISEIVEIEAKYLSVKVKLKEFLSELTTTSVSMLEQFNQIMTKTAEQQHQFLSKFTNTLSSSLNQSFLNQSSEEPHFTARLPRLSIPTFEGDYKEFQSFKDLFSASVDSKTYLSDAEKFQYLRSCLKGEPEELIRHFSTSEANYKAAWSKICDRYDKKRIAVGNFIQTFLDIPIVKAKSARKLRNLHNTADQVIRGLRALGPKAESRDLWLLHILQSKIDQESQQAWAISIVGKDYPKIEDFLKFIDNRCDGLETCEPSKSYTKSASPRSHNVVSSNYNYADADTNPCSMCAEGHRLYECEKFRELEPKYKRDEVCKLNVCFNCLSSSHRVNRSRSRRSCVKCGRRHHTTLHDSIATNINNTSHSSIVLEESRQAEHLESKDLDSRAKPKAEQLESNKVAPDRLGRMHTCNVLLDSGSQISFISESCARKLQLHRYKANILVGGLATSNISTTGKAKIEIHHRCNNSTVLRLDVFILRNITTTSQYDRSLIKNSEQFDELELADPNYFDKKDIDILIGADYFFNILSPDKVMPPDSPIAQDTIFGWVISGQSQLISENNHEILQSKHIHIQDDTNLELALKKFWEQEEVASTPIWTNDEQKCEDYFKATTKRDGLRIIVQLLFNNDTPKLGNTYMAAKRRLLAMERKMASNSHFAQMYRDFLSEYESLGHMVKLTSQHMSIDHDEVCYLPHHGVWKYTSDTTKLRVVFDGSCSSSNGVSLNDKLLVGPTIQLTFRKFPIALCADIEKMYRQILIEPCQTKYQRILWRNSIDKPIEQFELKTLTYGTSSASFLATRALLLIAEENEAEFPKAAQAIKENFYVDDALTGATDELEAVQLKRDLIEVLQRGGFPLRKWKSNIRTLVEHHQSVSILNEEGISQVLGLLWDPVNDVFHFNVIIPIKEEFTKREILSVISRLYDPLGWLSPFVIRTKLIMQHLWIAKISWDEKLPYALQNQWQEIKSDFETLKSIKIPRKSKVAPIQAVSLPRLELCGAHLLSKLVPKVCDALKLSNVPIYLWTDSTVVLSWIKSALPKKWKVYVANRTADIQKLVPNAIWRHVSSKDNPVDLATRGIKASQLLYSDLWWNGPKWLYTSEEPWPKLIQLNEIIEERRQNVIGLQLNKNNENDLMDNLITKFSKWSKLVRVISFILRFIFNSRTSTTKRKGLITSQELNNAEEIVIKYIQKMEFSVEISDLKKNMMLNAKSPLVSLAPFIDERGILRVGGRLQNATCSFATKHPLIIPKSHRVAIMILNYLHKKHLHPGPSLLVSLSRMRYWILKVRHTARSVYKKCVLCCRYARQASSQLMGNLPQQRVVPSRPFSKTGVDYAGPIMVSSGRGRGAKLSKAYIVIFVCVCTKALHIEIASDMTTAAFIAALKRFTSRRGVPNEILSDNGSNFRGTKNLLSDIYSLFRSEEWKAEVNQYVIDNQITWSFIPPLAPNFGGIWERAVRSIKGHLVKITSNSHLTYEELNTVLAQVECILNSRPLCAIKNEDPENIDALTPAHFLTMGTAALIPDNNYLDTPQSRLTRWQQVQQLVQSYWKRYSRDYLHTLQQRTSSKSKNPQFRIERHSSFKG